MGRRETANPGVSKWRATALPGRLHLPYPIRLLHAIRTDAEKVKSAQPIAV